MARREQHDESLRTGAQALALIRSLPERDAGLAIAAASIEYLERCESTLDFLQVGKRPNALVVLARGRDAADLLARVKPMLASRRA